MAGRGRRRAARRGSRRARRWGCSSRSPSWIPGRTCAATSRTVCASCATCSTALRRSRRIRRARRRLRRAARGAGEGSGGDRPPRRLVARGDARPRDGRAAPARGDRDVATLSGGERRRVALCRLLLSSPDLLLLDEPTNHLDAESVRWLERFLADYKGTVVAVTHDRYFLDNVAGWILELDRGRGIPFEGNYSSWLEQKQARLASEEKQASARRRTLARELEWVRMSPRARHAKSKARLASYEQLSPRKSASSSTGSRSTSRPARGSATSSSRRDDLAKGYGDRLLFEDVNFSLPPAGIVGVIGPNGAGKTTLFKLIAGEEQPTPARSGSATRFSSPTSTSRAAGSIRGTRCGRRSAAVSTRSSSASARSTRAQYIELVQLPRRRPAEAGREALGWRAQPRPPREAAAQRRQRAAARRADERPRRRHAARARGRAARLRRLRGRDHPRPLVPRPRRDAHPRLRGRQPGHVVRGHVGRVRRVGRGSTRGADALEPHRIKYKPLVRA